jgi:hypothetical protein
MPSTTSRSVVLDLFSSTVITPSLPTLLIALRDQLADLLVAVGGDRADLRDLVVAAGRLRLVVT